MWDVRLVHVLVLLLLLRFLFLLLLLLLLLCPGLASMTAMHVNSHRATLARYPNANPELDIFPIGYMCVCACVGGAAISRTLQAAAVPAQAGGTRR